MKKILTIMMVLFLIITLSSCDEAVEFMGMMGTNVMGVDKEQVSKAIESTKVTEDKKPNTESASGSSVSFKHPDHGTVSGELGEGSRTHTIGEGEGATTITTGKANVLGNDVPIIGLGETIIPLDPTKTKTDLNGVETILTPQDLSELTSSLEGAGKSEAIEELKKPVEDEETKKAAEGTRKIVAALLENIDTGSSEEGSEPTEAEKMLQDLQESLSDPDTELTYGDVAVLQALTNVLIPNVNDIAGAVAGSGEEQNKATENLLENANDSLIELVSVANNVKDATSVFSSLDLSSVIGSLSSSSSSSETGAEGNA